MLENFFWNICKTSPVVILRSWSQVADVKISFHFHHSLIVFSDFIKTHESGYLLFLCSLKFILIYF